MWILHWNYADEVASWCLMSIMFLWWLISSRLRSPIIKTACPNLMMIKALVSALSIHSSVVFFNYLFIYCYCFFLYYLNYSLNEWLETWIFINLSLFLNKKIELFNLAKHGEHIYETVIFLFIIRHLLQLRVCFTATSQRRSTKKNNWKWVMKLRVC